MANKCLISDLQKVPPVNPVMELKVYSRYGTVDSNGVLHKDGTKYMVVNADCTDADGILTVTLCCVGDTVIKKFTHLVHVGNTLRIKDFEVKQKTEKGKQNMLGDLDAYVNLATNSKVELIADAAPAIVYNPWGLHSIASFQKKLSQEKVFATLAVIAYEPLASSEKFFSVSIADGSSDEDSFILDIEKQSHSQVYHKICENIRKGVASLLVLKNVGNNNYGDRYSFSMTTSRKTFVASNKTIVADVTDSTDKSKLTGLYESVIKGRMVCKDFTGILTVLNAYNLPYLMICFVCKENNFVSMSATGECGICATCQKECKAVKQAQLEVVIDWSDGTRVFQETCSAKGKMMEKVIGAPANDFLNLARSNQIRRLSSINIKGDFKVAPGGELSAFFAHAEAKSDKIYHDELVDAYGGQEGGGPDNAEEEKQTARAESSKKKQKMAK